MPFHYDQSSSLPSLSLTAATNYVLFPSLHHRQKNSHDKIQNTEIPSKVDLGTV